MVTICDENWSTGCGVSADILNKIACWVNCNAVLVLLLFFIFIILPAIYIIWRTIK